MIAFSIMGKSCRLVLNCVCVGNTTVTFSMRRFVSGRFKVQVGIRNIVSHSGAVFMPSKVAVVTKTTRYEFEQQRYRFAELSKEDMKHLLAMKGSSYSGLRERHNIHTRNVEHIVDSLQREGVDVRVMQRGEYNEDTVRWADAIISAGGDGTMLLVASKVFDKEKPVVGVNTDPERSEGHLCLPVHYTHSFPEALLKFRRGEFRWQGRQRIRVHLEGTGINPTPVDLHDLQLSQQQHSQAHRLLTDAQRRAGTKDYSRSDPLLLPVRGLNEIFIGESLSSRASYYEISVDDGPWEKQKSSGINVCTGTGSKAWSYNINKLADQDVEDILKIGKAQSGLPIPLDQDYIEKLTKEYNNSLTFDPEDHRMYFSIREPITNRIYSCTLLRGFAKKVSIRSRCWDACMVVDGGTSFEFNDGAIATITMSEEDQLRTALLSE